LDADLDTLAVALYVTVDDLLKAHLEQTPARPKVGFTPGITDAEIITLAVMGALLGFDSERHFIRHARKHLRSWFPVIPDQSGYGKRLRTLTATMRWLITMLATMTSVYTDDVWVVDSTPVECARSRETVKRSDLAGFAEYGYCASHSRYFWGLRLHLVTTVHGLPIGWALTGAKADERTVLGDILAGTPALAAATQDRCRPVALIGDKNYFGHQFETNIAGSNITLLRPTRKGEPPRPGQRFFKPLRQIIESVNDTLKGQLSLERHGGRTVQGVLARITTRILAMTTAIWHNDNIGATIHRSLTAYDH
jgi:hypothetical protein